MDREKAQRQVAQEARGYVDELAGMVGSNPRVLQDVLTNCVPGDKSSGKELIYFVGVSTKTGAKARLLGEIRAEWESRGWTARTGGATDLRLQKGSFSIGAEISPEDGRASVGGGGGCVD